MSPDGHCSPTGPEEGAVAIATFAMAAGTGFEWRTHADHQVAWASSGVLTVVTETATWVLPPTRALWIPAGLPHETLASGPATMRALYLRADAASGASKRTDVSFSTPQNDRTPAPHAGRNVRGDPQAAWDEPTPLAAGPLLADLIDYLDDDTLDRGARLRAEAVLADLLTPVPLATIEVHLPADPRAREVAAGLAADPADRRTLAQWGRQVGASGRTLARAFRAGTGVPFGRWRTLVRLQAALPALAAGQPVARVAGPVGYDTASAFVAAFAGGRRG